MITSRREVMIGGLALGASAAGITPALAVPTAPVPPVLSLAPAAAGIRMTGINGGLLFGQRYVFSKPIPAYLSGFEPLMAPMDDGTVVPVSIELVKLDGDAAKYESLYVALKTLVPQEPRPVTNSCERRVAANDIAIGTRMAVANLIICNSKTMLARFGDDQQSEFDIFWTDESFPDDVALLTMNNSRPGMCRSFVFEQLDDGVLVKAQAEVRERAIFLDVSNYQTIDDKMIPS